METKYKLIVTNDFFRMVDSEYNIIASFSKLVNECIDTWGISNTKEQILAMYEEREAELKALEAVPVFMFKDETEQACDLNEVARKYYKQALLDNKDKKFTEEQLLEAIKLASDFNPHIFKYDYSVEEIINKITSKLQEVFVELEMEFDLMGEPENPSIPYPKVKDNKVTITKMYL